MSRSLSAAEARRLALRAQGFDCSTAGARASKRLDRRHFRRVLDRLSVVQLDSVNVCCRSHYMPFFSRLGPYDRESLDRYLNEPHGDAFEYWGHVASVMPARMYPFFRHRMDSMDMWRSGKALLAKHANYVERVHREVEEKGPLTVSDLSDPGGRTGPWWGYGKGKIALELLFMAGRVTARRGKNFIRLYDTPERSLAATHRTAPSLDVDAQYGALLERSAIALGVGTAKDLADYYRLKIPRARAVLGEMVEDGVLDEVTVEGWRHPAFVHRDVKPVGRRAGPTALLSPFDSLIFERDRVQRMFGFRYRIEIYVPAPKREYGYYVYPFLVDGRLVARVDLKADRRRGRLSALGVFAEPECDKSLVAKRLAIALEEMATWLGLDGVSVGPRGNLARALRRELRRP